MPEITSSCVWASRRIEKVGSSSAILASPAEILASSSRALGSTARGTIGIGNLIGRTRSCETAVLPPTLLIVSETCRSSNLAMATMSPAIASWTSSCCLPWSM